MPRRPRLVLPGVPMHVIQRGNNRQACFFSEEDYLFYLERLEDLSLEAGCRIHAYCLMTNHVHLLLTPEFRDSAAKLMKGLGQQYVQYINRTYRRTGTLWEGRFKSCVAREDSYILACYRYIELNPVRANMVQHPADYRWSSYRVNGQGERSDLVTEHDYYKALGEEYRERVQAYRGLFISTIPPELIDDIRESTNGNYALGSPLFKAQIEDMIGRRVTKLKPGRKKLQSST